MYEKFGDFGHSNFRYHHRLALIHSLWMVVSKVGMSKMAKFFIHRQSWYRCKKWGPSALSFS